MASSYIKAELAAACGALGRWHDGKYVLDSQCYESIRDIIRYLRHDDEQFQARLYLGDTKVLQGDLINVVVNCPARSPELFDITVRLLVSLTSPVLLLYREEVPVERIGRNLYMSLVSHTQAYKMAFCNNDFWKAVCAKLTDLFEVDWSDRSEDDSMQIEKLLVLVRNVLQVPADLDYDRRPENGITVHDQVLWSLRQAQLLELLLYISSRRDEEQYYLHLLEVFSLLLREQNPNVLAQSEVHHSAIERAKDVNDLVEVREREKEGCRKIKNMRNFPTTFVLKNVKSISDQDVIIHKSLDRLSDLKLTQDKKRVKTPKNRVPLESERQERRSSFSVRLFLKEFCAEFLNCSFNNLMAVVKDKLVSGKALSNDESYYFWALKFFLEFTCAHGLNVKVVSECVNAQSFHFIQTQMESCFEHLISEKKKTAVWVRRIHLILKAYHSLLKTMHWMDSSVDGEARDISKVLKSNVFYVPEYRELMLYCLLRYDPTKYSTSYLRDLIECSHLFLKLLEDFCKRSHVVVQKKTKQSKPRKRPVKEPAQKVTKEEKWDKIKEDVLELLQGETAFPEIPPFDAVLDIPIDDQKESAMKNIQKLLHKGETKSAIGLLRSAREVWPEGNIFGFSGMPVEEESMSLQEICLTELGNEEEEAPAEEVAMEQAVDVGSEDEEPEVKIGEQKFDVMDYIKRLANKKIVQGCCILLKNYRKNSNHTNHCAVKLLHRVGWECAMPCMLFQASFFNTLIQILNETNSRYRELQTFAVHLVRKFRENAQENPYIFVEILFWKDPKTAFDMENGLGKYEEINKLGGTWSVEEEEEIQRLWEECGRDMTDEKKIHSIKLNLANESRSIVGITKKLRQMGFLPKGFRAPTKVKLRTEWIEEEVTEVKKYYELFKEAADPVSLIWDRLFFKRPKKSIKEKLVELGLVGSVLELRKKRARDGARSNAAGAAQSPSSEDSDNPGDEDGDAVAYTEREQVIALRGVETMTPALEWLKETMDDCLEDDDPTDEYPLLPMDYPHFQALENDDFVDALRKLGLREPLDDNIHWKIPTGDKNKLRGKVKLIEKCLAKDWKEDKSESDEEDGDEFDRLRTMMGRSVDLHRNLSIGGRESIAERGGDEDSGHGSVTQESSAPRSEPEVSQTADHGQRIGSDASDSEGSTDLGPRRTNKKKTRKSIKRLIDSDHSDDEEEMKGPFTRPGCLGSDSDEDAGEAVVVPKPKRRRCIGSDSEVEESASGDEKHCPTEKFVKRPRMIDSDSDFEGNGSLDDGQS